MDAEGLSALERVCHTDSSRKGQILGNNVAHEAYDIVEIVEIDKPEPFPV